MAATTPEECDALFARHLNSGNVEGVVALYEPQASLVMEAENVARGTDAIRAAITTFASLRPTLTMHVTRVVRPGEDLAVLYNDWRLTGTAPDGSRLEDSGKAIEIVRRQPDGSWRLAIDDPRARG
jgi:uncharacterized protein (TIGR02246 family)